MAASPPAPLHRRPWRPLPPWQQPPDGSRLVQILAWEGDLDAAWTTAGTLGCSRSVRLTLAHQSEDARPEDALEAYRQEVDALLVVSHKGVYAQAVELLGRMRRLMDRLGRAAEFRDYATQVRSANARRPAFLGMFDAAELS